MSKKQDNIRPKKSALRFPHDKKCAREGRKIIIDSLIIPRFSEQDEHQLFVILNARLVKWIHAEHIPRYAARDLEKGGELAKRARTAVGHSDEHIGHIAV